MDPMDRRTFFRTAGALSLGAIAWACSKGTPKSQSSPASSSGALSVVPTAQYLAKGDTRQAFALIKGEKPIAPKSVKATITASDSKSPVPVDVTREQIQMGPGGGSPTQAKTGTEVLEIYVFKHDFTPGIWLLDVTADGKKASGAFQVQPDAPEPKIGEQAIASQSPTTSDHRGVDPICTRDPQCSMHQMTIADALANGKPTVITFAAPRFCQSRTCGPTVDIVESVAKTRSDVNFIHIEVFRNVQVALTENGDSPTYHEWKLGTDPITYFVSSDGTIKDHWTGSVGFDEFKSAVDALTKG